ncbi:MAG: helix-turn-helix transcriptional regulator [Clostridiales bacterium]|nr:helix-turn-helix transcriptional regulator [Clostridiales bacterium]
MDESVILGRVVRALRLEKEMSQFEVCTRSGLNLSYYCKIERGEANPSVKKLYAILRALDVSPIQFIDLTMLELEFFLIQPAV